MAKFKLTITRVDEYEVDIDENVWNEDALKEWSSVFRTVNDVEDIAKDFAVSWMRNDNDYFIEGYGYVKEYSKDGTLKGIPYRDKNGEFAFPLPEERYAKGISIVPTSQDDDYEVECEEIKTVKHEDSHS